MLDSDGQKSIGNDDTKVFPVNERQESNYNLYICDIPDQLYVVQSTFPH